MVSHRPQKCGDDDAMGSQEMGRMRDMMTAPAEEKQEETFANEPEEKVSDIDTLVNVHSGGLNRQKKTYPKVASGDNPMAAEDKITEEDLANSLRLHSTKALKKHIKKRRRLQKQNQTF